MCTKTKEEKELYFSYGGFTRLKIKIAFAFNEKLGKLYEKFMKEALRGEVSDSEEIKEYNRLCNNDLDILLWHSDCDGKLNYKECKKIYNVIKTYQIVEFQEELDKFKNLLEFCIKHRCNLYFY
jgi:hypothetical protein